MLKGRSEIGKYEISQKGETKMIMLSYQVDEVLLKVDKD